MTTPMRITRGLLGVLFASRALAQNIPEFNKLRTPVSPAFEILGIAPSQVERPTIPATFAATVLQNAQDFTGTLPKSFAVEVAPYWLFPHARLTFDKYQKQGSASLYRNLTVSLATTDSLGNGTASSAADFRRLGFGLRTTLFPGSAHPGTPKCVTEISLAATALAVAIGREVANAIAGGRINPADAASLERFKNDDSTQAKARAALSNWQQDLLSKEGVAKCTEEISARRGFSADLAAATAANFPGGRANSGTFSSAGVWITPGYLGTNFSNVAVVRYRWDDLDSDSRTNFDVGARSIYAWERYATSLELVNRVERQSGESSDFVRAVLNFSAKIAGATWLNIAMGKDFDAKQRNSFLAILDFQWQLGDRSVVPAPTP